MWSCALSKASLAMIYIGVSSLLYGQSWTRTQQTPISADVVSLALEDAGSLLLGTRSGAVLRYSHTGTTDEMFSEVANSPVTDIATWNPLRTFIFYRDLQRFALIDRFNTRPVWFELNHFEGEFVQAAIPGTDNSLWTLTTGSNELKKYDLQSRQLLAATPLQIDLRQVTDMIVFKNLMILADEVSGVHFFDQFGNLLKSVTISGVNALQILDGTLYAQTATVSYPMNPFQPTASLSIPLPNGTYHLWKDTRTLLVYHAGAITQYVR